MPYTQEELDSGNVEFYTNFRGKLRGEYLERVQRSAEQNFRDENNTLYSFEDILTGDGVESVSLKTTDNKDKTFSLSSFAARTTISSLPPIASLL